MNMFNNKGEINAGSVREAFNIISKYASILNDNEPSNMSMSGQVSLNDSQRDELVNRALMSQEGKIALAQAMANPIN